MSFVISLKLIKLTSEVNMSNVEAPLDDLNSIIQSQSYIASDLNLKVLDFFGCFVLKNAISPNTIKKYTDTYFESLNTGKLKKTDYHLTEVKINKEQYLKNIIKENELIAVVSNLFDGDVGSDFIRLVKKDSVNFEPVFLHQDTCYQIGGFERYSLFIALTECNPNNGALVLYPGTHHYGFLGDAGEIRNILPKGYPSVTSSMSPGDILLMHSSTWHGSPKNTDLSDRVYLEVHIQHIDEPNTRFKICGKKRSKWVFNLTEDDIFLNSRTQRLRKLYEEIERLEA